MTDRTKNILIFVAEYLLFMFVLYIINPVLHQYVASKQDTMILEISNSAITTILFIAVILEMFSFYFMSFKDRKFTVGVTFAIIVIPRIILFMTIGRTLLINTIGFASMTNSATGLFFLLLIIALFREIIVLLYLSDGMKSVIDILGMKVEKFEIRKKLSERQKYIISRLLFLPLFFVWILIYQETELVSVIQGEENKLWQFFGLYSTFVYLPLQITWIALSLEKKKKNIYFQVSEIILQPLFVYFATVGLL